MKKKNLGIVLVCVLVFSVGFTSAFMKFGNNDASLSIEQAGSSNIYDFKFNVSTCEEPILEIEDQIGNLQFKSFGKDIFGYNDASETIYFQKDVKFKDGVTETIELENYILTIENGIITNID